MEPKMVAKHSTINRPKHILPGYVPIASGPAREITKQDLDELEARVNQIVKDRRERLKRFKALNAAPQDPEMRRA